jgi:uncharacterized membrane protein YdjX (TVP38/TMEM64 family)
MSPTKRFITFVAIVVGLVLLSLSISVKEDTINRFLQGIPYIPCAVLFVGLYIIGGIFLWYMKDIMKIVGAILFGAYISTLLIYVAEIIDAYIFFHMSSSLGKDFLEKRVKGKFKNLYERLERLDTPSVFLLRAIPLIPYRVLDLSFGLSKFPFKKYILAVIVASLPRIFLFQFPLAAIRGFSFEKMRTYFLEHPTILLGYFLYLIVSIAIALKIKKRLK